MDGMREMRLRLETVTPAWIGGAGFQPELRPPTLRGCLRFWLRALLGGVTGNDMSLLRTAEAAVFGDPQRASQLVVRMVGSPQCGPATFSDEEYPGVCHLFWSVYQRKREAILPGEDFELRIHGRPYELPAVDIDGQSVDVDRSFELAASALWLFLFLGGAGARARRGAGTLRVVEPPSGWPATVPSPVLMAQNPHELTAESKPAYGSCAPPCLGRRGR